MGIGMRESLVEEVHRPLETGLSRIDKLTVETQEAASPNPHLTLVNVLFTNISIHSAQRLQL